MKKQAQKGVAIVEFALILPFLLLLTFITTEFGRAIWEYNTLTKSVRDASRYLAIQPVGTKITEARNLMVYGKLNVTGSDTPLALNLSLANVPVGTCCVWQEVTSTPVNGSAPVMRTVTVSITGYQFNSMFNSVLGLPFGQITFSDVSATMRTFL
jgi:Flp pilus assembly protein TadG